MGTHVAILQDLQGPKLRIGKVDGEINLEDGQSIKITTHEEISTVQQLSVSYKNLARDAKPGERILLNDGKVELQITEVLDDTHLKALVLNGGVLTSNKGFNLPDTLLSVPSLTKKDREDLEFGLTHDVDWIALSFVRKPEDIIELKNIISEKRLDTRVIAKIEKPEAVQNINEIIQVVDGIMVARGDLGVELPLQRVPLIQKDIVEKCIAAGKPVIIATQMMESMITDSMPTRAEITDVANAVLDGADAVMLSAETSVGKHPVRVVELMGKIITDVEEDRRVYFKGNKPQPGSPSFASDEVCFTAVKMSDHLDATAIAAMTRSGYTGFRVASYRPKAAVFIFTDNVSLLNRLSLVWGLRGFYYDEYVSTDQTFQDVTDILKAKGFAKPGDTIINCASMPIHKKQRTNTIKVTVVD
jgi:pyruvate kinase